MTLLKGIRVVEMGMWLAGPAAGGVLADWGADVIKVEPPSGDPMRQLFGAIGGSKETRCPPFDMFNRGKRSVAMDVNNPESETSLLALIGSADVFLTNMRQSFLARIGLDPERLMARFPRLIYASLTGYGLEGPDKDLPGYDVAAFFARSGVADRSRAVGEPPPTVAGGLGDVVTGMTMTAGILAGLVARNETGQGQLVSTSLLRNGIYALGMDVSTRVGLGKLGTLGGRLAPPNPLLNSYRCSDDRWFWMIGAESERHWPRLLEALGRPSRLLDEHLYDTGRDRRRNAATLVAALDEIFQDRSRDQWGELFDQYDVWWAPVNSVEDLLIDAQVLASGALVKGEKDSSRVESEQLYVATPVDFSVSRLAYDRATAPIGADTDSVLGELGVSVEEISRLRTLGVLSAPVEGSDGQ